MWSILNLAPNEFANIYAMYRRWLSLGNSPVPYVCYGVISNPACRSFLFFVVGVVNIALIGQELAISRWLGSDGWYTDLFAITFLVMIIRGDGYGSSGMLWSKLGFMASYMAVGSWRSSSSFSSSIALSVKGFQLTFLCDRFRWTACDFGEVDC